MIGTTVSAFAREDDTPINETRINIRSVTTERELVEREGFVYARLAIQDHTWPTPEEIDDFILLVRGLYPDQVWLHFHCQAGNQITETIYLISFEIKLDSHFKMKYALAAWITRA